MAGQSFRKLRNKTTAELREMAKGLEGDGLPGFSNLSRNELVLGLCKALDVPETQYKHVEAGDRKALKDRIVALKTERAAAIDAKDSAQLSRVRRKIHRLKRQLRAAAL